MAVDDIGNQFTGTRGFISVGGVVFAWSSSVSWGHNYQREPYQPLNNVEVKEHVILSYGATMSLSGVYLVSDNLTTLSIQPQLGATSQDHLAALLSLPELVVTVEDSTLEKVVATGYGCSLASSNIGAQSSAFSSMDITLYCRRIKEFGNA